MSRSAQLLGNWGPVRKAGVTIAQPVIVLWGGQPDDLAPERGATQIEGVTVVLGRHLRAWCQSLPVEGLRPEQVTAIWSALDDQVRKRDPGDTVVRTRPLSPAEVVGIAAAAFVTAQFGLLAILNLVRMVTPWAALPLGAALAAVARPMRSHRIWRYPALTWQTATVTTGIVIFIWKLTFTFR